jgi:hypothetical protein
MISGWTAGNGASSPTSGDARSVRSEGSARSRSSTRSRKKSESAKAAEELAAARVEAMMAAMTTHPSATIDEGEI